MQREARELKVVAALAPLLARMPDAAEEFATRRLWVRRHYYDAPWTPVAEYPTPGDRSF